MPKKKKDNDAIGVLPEAEISEQNITDAIEKNFMPYAMSVIVSRAIPEIDGFKPSHRKLLYTMYKMGLLTGPRTKSANIVGQTMRLNPHGDAAIYETLVRLSRGNETLLYPFVDSKGSFGKHYSSDMVYAASRYTEAKLDSFCTEIFGGIDHDAVDMCENYDGTMLEPKLLPTSFPNILLSPNKGIAVAMSSSICSFNLGELCDAAIQMLRMPETTVDQLLDILIAPDFQGGGYLIYNREELRELYRTGHGSIRLRAKWSYDKTQNCIDILQIPYSTTIELIMKKLTQLIKDGKLKEITDFRDEIDVNGFKLTIDLRRGTDPDKLMAKLFKMTSLEDCFDCNFNVLIDSVPKLLGVGGILGEWIKFRKNCVRREFNYDLTKKKAKLNLLLGLAKILLDIDKAIKIIRDTKLEADVVPNLMSGFDIDELQAEYIADIKLRNLNREYILNRLNETNSLKADIAEIEELLSDEKKMSSYIAGQLKEIKKKYAKPRQTLLIYDDDLPDIVDVEPENNSTSYIVYTSEGYLKKVTERSLRTSESNKLKNGDVVVFEGEVKENDELIFFSDLCHAYKAHAYDFELQKMSELGEYIPAKLGFEQNEKALFMCCVNDWKIDNNIIFVFENGYCVKIPISAYETKTNRKKLTKAYSDVSPIVGIFSENEHADIYIESDGGRGVVVGSEFIPKKSTRDSRGNAIFTLKKGQKVVYATCDREKTEKMSKFRKSKFPSNGMIVK